MDRVNFLDIVRTIKDTGERISSLNRVVYDCAIKEYCIRVYEFKDYHDVYLYKNNELVVEIYEVQYYRVADFEDKVNDTFGSGGTITDVVDAYIEEKEMAERLTLERERREKAKVELLKEFMR